MNVIVLRDKKCNRCKCWRKEEDFISNERLVKCCKVCREESKKYNAENADKVKEQQKKYYIENADKIKEQQKKWRIDNADKVKEGQKKYRIENVDKVKQYRIENVDKKKEKDKKYYIENADKVKERSKKYKVENADKIKETNKNYCIENADKIKQNRETIKKENPLKVKIKFMVSNSKYCDKKYNRTYDADNFITEDFLNELWVKQNKKCYYQDCECELILCFNKDTRENNMITIQRLDNQIAHIKSNCVLSCYKCNVIAHKELNELN